MTNALSTTISILAFAVSAITAWLTLFRGGTVKMTQPTVIFFGPDSSRSQELALPKVYLRTLLFATSKRGRVIEGMYIALSRNETRQNFNIWVYGDEKLVRGSGLFVGETGGGSQSPLSYPERWQRFPLHGGSLPVGSLRQAAGRPKSEAAFLTDSRSSTITRGPSRRARFGFVFRLGARFFALPATRGQEARIAGSRGVPGTAWVTATPKKSAGMTPPSIL
jgi:hypothetical protein